MWFIGVFVATNINLQYNTTESFFWMFAGMYIYSFSLWVNAGLLIIAICIASLAKSKTYKFPIWHTHIHIKHLFSERTQKQSIKKNVTYKWEMMRICVSYSYVHRNPSNSQNDQKTNLTNGGFIPFCRLVEDVMHDYNV